MTHAMLAMPTTILGEVLVKWVEGLQTRLPMCVGGAIFGPLRFRAKQRERYPQVLPWAIRSGIPLSFKLEEMFAVFQSQSLHISFSEQSYSICIQHVRFCQRFGFS